MLSRQHSQIDSTVCGGARAGEAHTHTRHHLDGSGGVRERTLCASLVDVAALLRHEMLHALGVARVRSASKSLEGGIRYHRVWRAQREMRGFKRKKRIDARSEL